MRRASIQTARHGVQIAVYLLIGLHLYSYYGLGDRRIGSVGFEEFFRSFLQRGVFNAGALLVAASLLLTLILGRVFCGWACHFGALQEFCRALLKRAGIAPRVIDPAWMRPVPVVVLGLYFLWPTLVAWRGGLPEVSVDWSYTSIWEVLPGPAVATATFVVNGCLLVLFFGTRGFCRLLCPWGAMMKPFNYLSRASITLTGKCAGCRACVENCQMGIDVHGYVNREGRVQASECIKCLSCVSACPHDVLALRPAPGWGVRNIGTRHAAERHLERWEQGVVLGGALAGLACLTDVGTISPLLALAVGALGGMGVVMAGRAWRNAAAVLGGQLCAPDAWGMREYALVAATVAVVAGIGVTGVYKGARDLGARRVARDDVSRALGPLRVASWLAPWNANLLSARAMIHLRLGQESAAHELARRAVEADPRDIQARRVLAAGYRERGDLAAAVREYERIVAMAPRDGEARLEKCRLFEALGMPAAARACIDEGIRDGVLAAGRGAAGATAPSREKATSRASRGSG